MAHSFNSSLFHCVFSTKQRRNTITPDLQERLWPYFGGIARENKMRALSVGGIEDHVHVLLSLPSTMPISKAMQLIKGGSSKWVHDTFPEHHAFAWQEGYGAFSIGVSHVTGREYDPVHQLPTRSPSQKNVSGRISGVFGETRH